MRKLAAKILIFLVIFGISFSNIPFWALTGALDAHMKAHNIVDKAWHLSQNDNVVDNFTSYRNLIEKIKVYEARAATIEFVGGASASGINAAYNMSLTALTGGIASAPAQGDIVIVINMIANTTNGDPGVGTAGYTEVADLYRSDSYDTNLSTNYKIMGASPDTVVSCNPSNSGTRASECAAMVFRGIDTTTPLDVTFTSATAINSEDVNCPAITPITAGAIVVCTGGAAGASVDTPPTPPSGYSGSTYIQTDPGNAGAAVASYKAWSGSGAEDPAAYVMDLGTASANSWAAITLALRPTNDPPTLTVSQPDGTGDTVNVGDLYNITYDLSDAEETVTAAMYYDTNASGLDGTAITGACATTAEGSGATCSWDTTGMTAGTYYVYGITNDGVNPQVSDYSPGVITINAAGSDATSYTNTETALDFANCATTGCGGRIGQQITIAGTNFGTPANKDVCTSGATNGCVRIANYTVPAANISSWIATQIVFTIPSDITVYGGSGTTCGGADGNGICVTQNGNDDPSGTLEFWVFPDITSTTPAVSTGAKEGDSVTISGNRFGSSGGTLVFQNCAGGDVDATPTGGNWADTSLTVTVPSGIADDDDSCDIKITRAAGTGSKTDTTAGFVILPNITSVSTNAASARECVATDTDCNDTDTDGLIKLIGNHFGTSAGTAQFTGAFGSISATVHATAEGACDVSGWAAAATSVCVETNPTIIDSVNVGNITLTRTGDSKTHDWTSYRIIPRITSITPSADGVNPDSRTMNGNHFCQSGSCLSAASWNAAADDGDDVKFSTTNATVIGTPSDTAVAVTVPTLSPGGYTATLYSNSFSSNGKPFTYLDNTPANPSSLNQYQSNCSTVIADEATTASSTVCLKGAVSGGITGGTLYLQVEVRASATGFTDAIAESTGVSAPSGGTESIFVTPGQGTFKWRARTCHWNNIGTHNLACTGTGDYPSSLFPEFETGAVPTTDFTIDSNGPVISNISSGTPGEFNVTITWDTDELATSNINYGTTTTGPYSFIAPNPADTTADTTTPHSVSISTNLNCGTTYYYIIISEDAQGTPNTPAEQTFTTGTCNPRVMKTLEFDWVEETSPVTVTTQQDRASLSAAIQESSDADFTIRSAALEMRGVMTGSGGSSPTANLWINSASTPTAITFPNTTIPQAYTVRYSIPTPSTNLNISPLSASTNTVHFQFGGGFSKASLVNVKLIITYDYTP